MRALLILFVLCCLAGCAETPEQQLAGVWTVDRREVELPPLPIPDAEKQIKQFLRGAMLKLRTDGTAVVAFGASAEGTWTLEGDTIRLKPTKGAITGPFGSLFEELEGTVSADKKRIDLTIATVPFPFTLVFRKTS
jgi:hypothetical protein